MVQVQLLGTKNFPQELAWSCQCAVNLYPSPFQRYKAKTVHITKLIYLSLDVNLSTEEAGITCICDGTRTAQQKMEGSCKHEVCRSVRFNVSNPTDTAREPFCKLLCINNTVNITKMLSPVLPANSRWKVGVPFTTLCLQV